MNGYAIEVELLRVIDGDTAIVAAVGNRGLVTAYATSIVECPQGQPIPLRFVSPGAEARVRFEGYSAPERSEPGGLAATRSLIAAFAKAKDKGDRLWLFVRAPRDANKNGRVDLTEILGQWASFERGIAKIMVGDWETGCVDLTTLI